MAQVSSSFFDYLRLDDPVSILLQTVQDKDNQLGQLQAELAQLRSTLDQSHLWVAQLEGRLAKQDRYLENFQYGQYFQCTVCQVSVDDFDENAVHICNCSGAVSLCRECFESSPRSKFPLACCQGCHLSMCDACQRDHPDICWDCLSRAPVNCPASVDCSAPVEAPAGSSIPLNWSTDLEDSLTGELLSMDELCRFSQGWMGSVGSSEGYSNQLSES